MKHVVVLYRGPYELHPTLEAIPDIAQMFEDVDRETRKMHDGRLLFMIPDPQGWRGDVVHVYSSGFIPCEPRTPKTSI